MRKESTESRSESRPEWEQLEDWVRSQVQRLIQELLEEEVTEFLGRAKSALRSDSDNDTGYGHHLSAGAYLDLLPRCSCCWSLASCSTPDSPSERV